MASSITNVFVVVLENRSFDHMLGWSGITGTDAVTGQQTSVQGVDGSQSNQYNGQTYLVSNPAPATVPVDPGHEFLDALIQLSGPNASYPSGGPYPTIDNSGFVADWAQSPSPGEGNAPPADYGQIMQGFSASQLPVLNALAKEFVVCDNWCSSLPGPTWPNRFFGHGASSVGLDHSPTTKQIIGWETGVPSGFVYPNGSIYDALRAKGLSYRLYFAGNFSLIQANLPIVSALHNIKITDVNAFSNFAGDLNESYPYPYTYIEPSYGDVAGGTYEGGNSQHPLDGVTNGEAFLKSVYETLAASPIWSSSLLIVTWDEHGGFYDHVPPGPTVNPGDVGYGGLNRYSFNFEQLGVRVPAVVCSPLIPQNLIDHRVYDHSSLPATVEAIFGISPLTKRDAAANSLSKLVTLSSPRSTPKTLPNPVTPAPGELAAAAQVRAERAARAKDDPIDTGNLPGFVHLAMRVHKQMTPPEMHPAIHARVAAMQTRADAQEYLREVEALRQTLGFAMPS